MLLTKISLHSIIQVIFVVKIVATFVDHFAANAPILVTIVVIVVAVVPILLVVIAVVVIAVVAIATASPQKRVHRRYKIHNKCFIN
jgi:hypothetical protein